ncbi:MAG: hypothetical protein M1826_001035, partial [Phylliscum demangeonii]
MPPELPEGIVTSTELVSAEIGTVDVVQPEDVHRLWKVYNTTRHVLVRNTGPRLENLFWRLGGDRARLCRALTGSTVARLFDEIHEDHNFVRRLARRRRRRLLAQRERGGAAPSAVPTHPEARVPAGESAGTRPAPTARAADPPPPAPARPPILKKGGKGKERAVREAPDPDDTALLSAGSDPGSDEAPSHPEPDWSTRVEPWAVGAAAGPGPKAAEAASKRKRTTFVAGGTSRTRKPRVDRRKSSLSSMGSLAAGSKLATTTTTTTTASTATATATATVADEHVPRTTDGSHAPWRPRRAVLFTTYSTPALPALALAAASRDTTGGPAPEPATRFTAAGP